jgi:DNA-directed RNA polymerase alpha subunit
MANSQPENEILFDLADILRDHGWRCIPPEEAQPDPTVWAQKHISKDGIASRVADTIAASGIESMSELVSAVREKKLVRARNFGEKSREALVEALKRDGYLNM